MSAKSANETKPTRETDDAASGASRRTKLLGAAASVCGVTGVAGIVLRLTLRDRVPFLAAVYYALPPAVLAPLALASCGLSLALGRPKRALLAGLLAAACSFWWWETAWFWNTPQSPAQAVRLLFWNCRHGHAGWNRIAGEIKAETPSLIGLVEADKDREERNAALRRHFPAYNIGRAAGGILVLVDGQVLRSESRELGRGGRCGVFDLRVQDQEITAIVADIDSNPLRPRLQPLSALKEIIEEHSANPVVVVGDFNTPPDSVAFDDWQGRLRNGFRTAGRGLAATWPVPVPILPLDQVWVNGRLRVEGCRLGWSRFSDHRPVVTDVTVDPVMRD